MREYDFMKCGVKFCGGCNPRYERGAAFKTIRENLDSTIEFDYAEENQEYDNLLIIGGCSACCASYKQYNVKGEIVKMWDKNHIPMILEKMIKLENI